MGGGGGGGGGMRRGRRGFWDRSQKLGGLSNKCPEPETVARCLRGLLLQLMRYIKTSHSLSVSTP